MTKIAFSEKAKNFPVEALKKWFEKNKRSLPWRDNPTPYSVWVSEVMLQQTRAEVVIDYFNQWMERFPTIESLAAAKEEDVIKLWEGLGYYSRARHLLEGARMVMEEFHGKIPDDAISLAQIRGVGPYTVHAILAFAFKRRAAAVDGNVLRVLSRIFLIETSIDLESTRTWVSRIAQALLPHKSPEVIAEALIELGACICKKVPQCHRCPVRQACGAWRENKQFVLPVRHARKKVIFLHRLVAIVLYDGSLVVEKRRPKEMMAGLYEFPYIEVEPEEGLQDIEGFTKKMELSLESPLEFLGNLKEQRHAFTNHKVHLCPIIFKATSLPQFGELHLLSDIDHLAFSSGHKKIKDALLIYLGDVRSRESIGV
ncbi:A/G-specific adenine glycosylase [Chlamydia pneumoniae TW-183]|uniref:Adenine DNA glycosylase n=2 Tax=Chlamydia pneumoniae TaxID=83558 RepID=Q9Z8E1_CHLPN|nr:A/G-specific adenine glycosylase [Chlamydia pneumoniae]AAD18546.1 Adenine Glycosylase [Chlamydia pneumoniae CWL029]AAF73658.1 A/G-specific adenine glycosylase [Chlamydia pneumoniae AR39]AAP98346.1 A/G-specific adenine glycosylase [Chlamydia pneumoniae TW-183]CRI32904.1 Probable A/G-specific adenine glycosylase YfhQ [Chlamydia pneumoniae]CRI35767.1 Probable A/G-specific adenine glycosylase YfhQ [Chlamydia pneumoniae]